LHILGGLPSTKMVEVISTCTSVSMCNDNQWCNGQEICQVVCRRGPPPCENLGVCNDQCNEGAETCYSNEGTPCDDGIWCNGFETCNGHGECVGPAFGPCDSDSQNPCNSTCNEDLRNCLARFASFLLLFIVDARRSKRT
jgi:hypothetical protein